MSHSFLPPATIGIIGGGQLGMMTIREAQRMGYRSIVWDPDPQCPASRLADETLTAPFNDSSAVSRFVDRADVITYEFEHIDTEIVRSLERLKPVRPASDILRVSQNRRVEKEELGRRGFPLAEYAIVNAPEEFRPAVVRIGLPVVVKTTSAGYDGKGQTVLSSPGDVESFVSRLPKYLSEHAVEKFLELNCEVSVIVVRNRDGEVVNFPVAQNIHRENILHSSIAPALVSAGVQNKAVELARAIIESFGIVGVLCVEMFVTKQGTILVNELAPRPHNSGHYSLDGCDLSQFEALVRVVAGLPLREPKLLTPCAIVNLLGRHLSLLKVDRLQKIPGTKLHLYGKMRVEPKRKMGHIAILRRTPEDVLATMAEVEKMIGETPSYAPSRKELELDEVR